jgi:hypothetical protein
VTRSMRAVCLFVFTMTAVGVAADPTNIVYLGPTEVVYGRDVFMRAVVFSATSGNPIDGATVTFTLGDTSMSVITNAAGNASLFLTVSKAPGTDTLHVAFAGDVSHGAAAQNIAVTVLPQPSAIFVLGDRTIPAGAPKSVDAELVDADTGAPIAGKTVRFSIAGTIADALSDSSGRATTSIQISAATAAGSQAMDVSFAGDANVLPSSTSQLMYVFAPSRFVIWGGNATGVRVGDKVVFLSPDWFKQVKSGDYKAGGDFKGLIDASVSLTEACGTASCWTAKPGDLRAPATASVVSALVSTSIVQKQGKVSGNATNIAIIAVDPTSTATTRTGTVLYLGSGSQPQGD